MAKFPQVGDDFGPYRITDQIGQGGMGVVYAAEQSGLGRTVALKVLAPQYAAQDDYHERFVREASTLARLDSVHVIHIYDHGEQDGCLYIAMQNVRGGDLGQAVKAAGGLPVRDGAEVVAQTAAALHDAHKAGVIHRDVKPSNVLLRDRSDDLHAYLCDFGIAQGSQPGLTVAGSVAGTMGYMAPERCRGEAATPGTDIYALGCVLWTTLAGRAPYSGTDVEVGLAHLGEPIPQFVEDGPVARMVNAVLRRSMAKDPSARYDDAAAMRRDLRAVADRARAHPEHRLVPAQGGSGQGGAGQPGAPGGGRSHGTGSSSGLLARPSGPRVDAPPPRSSGASSPSRGSDAALPLRPTGPPRPVPAPHGSGLSQPSQPSSPSNPAQHLPPRPGGSSPSQPSGPSLSKPGPGGAGSSSGSRGSDPSYPAQRPTPGQPSRPGGTGRSGPGGSPGSGLSGQAIAAIAVAGTALLVLLLVVLLTL